MQGLEIAWRTLDQEPVDEPCIVGSFVTKASYYTRLTGRDYWADMHGVYLQAMPMMGINLCPQLILPHDELGNAGPVNKETYSSRLGIREPEEILPLIEQLPSDEVLEREFNLENAARRYAEHLISHNNATDSQVLFITGYGMPDFMGPYNEWGYVPYMAALALYPEYIQRYFHYTATCGYLYNLAVVAAIRGNGLAPYVYGGQDICGNLGPLCSVPTLDALYFPELRRAIQPLLDADIRIVWHCDGNIMPILDRLLEIGVSGLQGFQEEMGVPFAQMVGLRSRWGRPLILWGSVSVTTTLPFGTVEDVQADVRRCFALAGPGRGFGLAASSSVMPEVPDENINALYQYGREYGRRFLRGDI
mgnify:CR=1 FL=1